MNGKIAFRISAALVLIVAIAGIAYFAFNAGVAQGSPITVNAPEGQAVPAPNLYYGWGIPFHHPFGFGFGCFGPLIALFLFFVALKAFRMMMWGPRFGHMHHGPWRHGWGEQEVPPMVEEWHKRMHGEAPAEDKKE